jgi:hypothetical protein
MATYRTERVRYTEVDQVDMDTRWQHAGGRYDIWASPDPEVGSPGSPGSPA